MKKIILGLFLLTTMVMQGQINHYFYVNAENEEKFEEVFEDYWLKVTQKAVDDFENKVLAKKVFLYEAKKYTDRVPDQRSAMLKIDLVDGLSFFREVIYPKGEPENPMLDEELKDKYRELAAFGGVSLNSAEQLMNQVWLMPDNLHELFGAIKSCNTGSVK